MRLISSANISDALTSSNVPEDDHPEWDAAATYASGDRVIVIGTVHKIYESAQDGNIGHDPTDSANLSWWTVISATNRWKAFDTHLSDPVINDGTIEYVFTVPMDKNFDRVAIIGSTGAAIDVSIDNASGTEIYSRSENLIDSGFVTDWNTFFRQGEFFRFRNEVVFEDLPAFPGYTIRVVVSAGTGTARLGQIVIGRGYDLGVTIEGTDIDFDDSSRIERDEFGGLSITKRDYAKRLSFQFAYPKMEGNRILRLLGELRASPVFFYDRAETDLMGTSIFGIIETNRLSPSAGTKARSTLTVKGFT